MASKDKLNKNKMLVRYGKMGMVGWFSHHEIHLPHTTSKVVIKTERGLEIGKLVGEHSYKNGNLKTKCQDLHQYYEKPGDEYPIGKGGTFVRIARESDLREEKHIIESSKEELDVCLAMVKELGLKMKIVDFEHIFGGERVVFYFLSDGRVDFRELVKRLARDFQTRIEMRQIGARDEARIISDHETCGQQCCCARYLKILKPVNMRMAKVQKATLDPSKISGHCGRLRCCLRFEDDTYKDLKANLPNRATRVKTEHGEGKVVDYQILTQLVKVLHDDGKFEAVPLESMEILKDQRPPQQKKVETARQQNNSRPERRNSAPRKQENRKKTETNKDAQSNATEQKDAGNNKQQGGKKPPRNRNRRRKPNQQNTENKQTTNEQENNKQDQKKPANTGQRNRRRRPANKNAPAEQQNTNAQPNNDAPQKKED